MILGDCGLPAHFTLLLTITALVRNREGIVSPRRPSLDGIGKVSLAHLRHVSETLVIPLWARSVESGRSNGILHDPQAERILPQLDYDFCKFRDAAVSQLTLCVRARTIDRWVS